MEFRGRVFLAPLTKGGNLPFRRLCLRHGCSVTMGEMAYAYQVVKRSKSELALLRKHADETEFGAQIAASKSSDAIAAGLAAVERGASWVDLNCGCPIHDIVRRGMGAVLLQRPAHLGRLVGEMVKGIPVPVTVKIRLGWAEGEQNASEVAKVIEEAGAAAVSVHGRTREQRYSRAADWEGKAPSKRTSIRKWRRGRRAWDLPRKTWPISPLRPPLARAIRSIPRRGRSKPTSTRG
jgi:tRNA-dihydrouridine synthase 3